MSIYAKDDKRRLYWLIDEYLAGRINEDTFCDEYHYSYNLEIDPGTLNEIEREAFFTLGQVSDRFSPFESDYELDPHAFTTREDLRQTIEGVKKVLSNAENESHKSKSPTPEL